MAEVTLSGIEKAFGATRVLKGIDARFEDGEFVVILGPSGCGKSTLLRIVAGLETETAGEVRIGGTAMTGIEPADRDIAMVFQNYALYPHMSVGENMGYGLKVRGMGKAEIADRVRKAAETLELGALLDRKPRQLSGGQRQRVAMGRAIVRDPKVFLFDEPLSNLDAKLRVQMRLEIKKLHQRMKVTSIFVTHDQVEAMTLADRIVVMNGGVAEQIGTPLEVYERPATTFVAGFIGSPAMNLVEVTAGADGALSAGGVQLASWPGAFPAGKGVLGVRPEAISLGVPPAGAALAFEGVVDLVEPLGAETLVHLDVGGASDAKIVARVPGTALLKPGERIGVSAAAGDLHRYDPASGRRIG